MNKRTGTQALRAIEQAFDRVNEAGRAYENMLDNLDRDTATEKEIAKLTQLRQLYFRRGQQLKQISTEHYNRYFDVHDSTQRAVGHA
ncbi:hypothetical protein LCGC14_1980760 [marine sediment metagenome]|uniref:Uncharacterized protein n=1 Tax=marine sediment metagenome TaxID=412755 RepID=A0A0F9F8Z2_9ZZZZ